jgi:hypothetical protein
MLKRIYPYIISIVLFHNMHVKKDQIDTLKERLCSYIAKIPQTNI